MLAGRGRTGDAFEKRPGDGCSGITMLGIAICLGMVGCNRGSGDDDVAGETEGATDSEGSGDDLDEPPENAELVPESMARRLSQAEFDNTVMALLADDTRPANRTLGEPEYTPFDNEYALQVPSRVLIESLEILAIDVGTRLVTDPQRRAELVPCTPSGSGDSECLREFIETFGRRAFRRPLTNEEVEAYMTLQAYSTENNPHVDNDFYTAVALVIEVVLQDPEFLYRIEVGTPTSAPGVARLDGWEIASRMSYLLWGSTPDDELLQDAEDGRLDSPSGRLAAAQRMLEDPLAREQMKRYHAMWLGYRAIPHGADLTAAFSMETGSLIERVIFDERLDYTALFTLDETYVDDTLAGHYGLPSPDGGEGWVSYADTGRSGILGHGSVLASFSKFSDTSPTQRGIFIRERLMCAPVPPPPPEVDVDNPPEADDPEACKEARYDAHRETPSCATCHNLFDPIGVGLENYDMAGVYREHDDGRPECTIEGDGELPGVGPFTGPAELADRLIESGQLEACAVEHYLSYAYGRALQNAEYERVSMVSASFADAGHDFVSLMSEYVGDEIFAFRREPTE
jgi:hypothetical protein